MVQGFLRIFGVIFLLLGIAGFFLPPTGPIHDLLHLTTLHNGIHLLTGIVFLAVSGSFRWSKVVSILFGALYAITVVLSFFTADLFGLMTLTPTIKVVHFVVAVLALFVGFTSSDSTTAKQTESA